MNTDLIIGDLLFAIASFMIRITDGLSKSPIILGPLLVISFVTCIVRHINYYKLTRKIY
jgi:hypothetical protein